MTGTDLFIYNSFGEIFFNRKNTAKGIFRVNDSGNNSFFSYKQLHEKALNILHRLQSGGMEPGDELIFQLNDNIDFISIFQACILGRIVPVPVTTGNSDEHLLKVLNIWKILKRPHLVTSAKHLEKLEKFISGKSFNGIAPEIRAKTYLTGELEKGREKGKIFQSHRSDVAFIQFSSGSTGDPKGVVLTHENLLINTRAIQERFGRPGEGEDTFLSWMPLTHDMGLICMCLTPILADCNLHLMASELFVRKPHLWLREIARHGATISASPNFGFNHALKLYQPRLYEDMDLSTLRIIVNGAEPISMDICREFINKMAPHGLGENVIIPGYGLAEASVAVSISEPGENIKTVRIDRDYLKIGDPVKEIPQQNGEKDENGVTFVEVGYPIEDCSVRIADEDGAVLDEMMMGNIQVSGGNVTSGYYHNPEENARVLNPDGWLNTGDIGFLRDGRLVITGRKKDVIFVNGQNYYPHDIERVAEEVGGVQLGKVAVSSVYNAQRQEDEILCFVVFRRPLPEFIELMKTMNRHILGELALQVDKFIPVKRIFRTTSGKLQRYKLKKSYLEGEYESVIREISTLSQETKETDEEIENTILDICRAVLRREDLGLDDNFIQSGGDSLKAVLVASQIHKELNVSIPLLQLFTEPTARGMAAYLRNAGKSAYYAIKPVEYKEYYPLSSAQERIYTMRGLEGESRAYNVLITLPIKNSATREKLHGIFQALINRHESLRTSFKKIDDQPVQEIHREVDFEIEYFNIMDTGSSLDDVIETFNRPFELSGAPLFRVGLVDMGQQENLLLIGMHHIVTDGTSMDILSREFMLLYDSRELQPLHLQYKDFAAWQNNLLESGKIQSQVDYWLNLYTGEIPKLEFPADYKRPPVFTFEGDVYRFSLEPEILEPFKSLCQHTGSTLFINILAAFNVLAWKYSGQMDIITGTGTAGRRHADLRDTVGMFVNLLALRNYPDAEKPYRRFLEEVKTGSLQALENQDVQFEYLIEKLHLQRDPSRNPLFDILLVAQNFSNTDKGPAAMMEGDLSAGGNLHTVSRFDMTFYIYEEEGRVYIDVEYYTRLFKRNTIQRMVGHFKNIIKIVAGKPSILLKDIDFMPEEERKQVLHQFNDTHREYPHDKTISTLFEEMVERHPHRIAVIGPVGEGTRNRVTYRELNHMANRLARYLQQRWDIRPDQPVGLLMNRSVDMIVAVLGILKAGGAYLPLDPTFPVEAMANMLRDSGTAVVVSQKYFVNTLNRLQWECASFRGFLCIDSTSVYAEEESETSELMERKLWHFVAETSNDDITGGGWLSSYTGQPIPREEMDEYGDNVLKKLIPQLGPNMRVLEIGCASGITMRRIAPKVKYYHGTDLSAPILEKNLEWINELKIENIRQSCLPAHEIDKIEDDNFDIVIINSVIQCFHGHNYLRKVLRKAVDLIGNNGYLFIGDIMDQDLKQEMLEDFRTFKQIHRGKGYKTKTDWSSELFISRGFLSDLVHEIPGMGSVGFTGKIFTFDNELTRYRYDALFNIDKNGGLPSRGIEKNKFQHDLKTLEKYGTGPVAENAASHNLAYIIYTSGSTGKPKGTLTTHYNVTRVVKNTNYIQIQPNDRILQLSNYAFDGSVFDIYGALLNGAALVMGEKNELMAIDSLADIIKKEMVTVFFVTTALFNMIVEMRIDALKNIRKVLFGGERVSVEHTAMALRYMGENHILHVYGPTETTVYATWFPVNRVEENAVTIPIGYPIANTGVVVLDHWMKPVPIGVNGEVYIGGTGVARGYLNRPQLTAEKFVQCRPQSGIYYRTGDLARWLPDGSIEFCGRIDHQVKIRGFRIEPGEIEKRLLSHVDIREAVVLVGTAEDGEKYLCAYVAPEVENLKEFLQQTLPEYMIPNYIIPMDKLPLTTNGKIDRKALPVPQAAESGEITAPENEIQEKLAKIWSDILKINPSQIGTRSNFFEIGGHSLKATVLVSKIHKEFDVKLPLAEVFKSPTIEELSQYIPGAGKDVHLAIKPVEKKEYYLSSPAQKRLYILQKMETGSLGYNMAGQFVLEGPWERIKLEESLRQLIRRHESFRTSFAVVGEEIVQVVRQEVNFEMVYREVRDSDEIPGIIDNFVRPFDLSVAPLLRAELIENGVHRYILLLDMHHIISDGISVEIFLKELFALYQGESLKELKLQYKDFSRWQNTGMRQDWLNSQKTYWLRRFSGGVPTLDLPTDYPRPRVQNFIGDSESFEIGEELINRLNSLAVRTGTTLFMILLAIYNILLSKYTMTEDIVVGSPIAGRTHADLKDIIGMFVNMLPMRNFPASSKTFTGFLDEVKKHALDAYENQDYPFDSLVADLKLVTDGSRHPLVETVFVLENIDMMYLYQKEILLPGLKLKQNEIYIKRTKFDLEFSVTEIGNKLVCNFDYRVQLFSKETILGISRHFLEILETILNDPEVKLSDIALVDEKELVNGKSDQDRLGAVEAEFDF